MKVLCWKDEGNSGPCRVYESRERMDELDKTGWPFGTVPRGMDPKGWRSRSEAKKLAKKLGAEFEGV